ncbi:MAG: hypothetical protein QXJ28_01815, partial [Candidatus Pacearchaeota archaeon]
GLLGFSIMLILRMILLRI